MVTMTEEPIMDKIIYDLVENRNVFNSMKEDISDIIMDNDDGNEFNMTYDEFCISCLDKIKKKNIKSNSTVKTVKDHFFDSMIEIVVDELEKRGRTDESNKIREEYLNNKKL